MVVAAAAVVVAAAAAALVAVAAVVAAAVRYRVVRVVGAVVEEASVPREVWVVMEEVLQSGFCCRTLRKLPFLTTRYRQEPVALAVVAALEEALLSVVPARTEVPVMPMVQLGAGVVMADAAV